MAFRNISVRVTADTSQYMASMKQAMQVARQFQGAGSTQTFSGTTQGAQQAAQSITGITKSVGNATQATQKMSGEMQNVWHSMARGSGAAMSFDQHYSAIGGRVAKGFKAADQEITAFAKTMGFMKTVAVSSLAALTGFAFMHTVIHGTRAAFQFATQSIIEFDDAMVQSTAIQDHLSNRLKDGLAQSAMNISKITAFSPTEAAKGLYYLASAGYDANEQMRLLPMTAKFAQAGIIDLEKGTEMLSDVMKTLNFRNAEGKFTLYDPNDINVSIAGMKRVSDVIVETAVKSNATVEQVGQSFTNKFGTQLRILQKMPEEGGAIIQAFANVGIKGQVAGTYGAMVLRDLQTTSLKNASAYREAGIAVYDQTGKMRKLYEILGDIEKKTAGMTDQQKKQFFLNLKWQDRSSQGILALVGQSKMLQRAQEGYQGGFTDTVAARQMESLKNQIAGVRNAFARFFIDLGAGIRKAAGWMAESFTPAVNSIRSAISSMVDSLKPVGLVVGKIFGSATVGGLLSFAKILELSGKFVSQFSNLISGLLTIKIYQMIKATTLAQNSLMFFRALLRPVGNWLGLTNITQEMGIMNMMVGKMGANFAVAAGRISGFFKPVQAATRTTLRNIFTPMASAFNPNLIYGASKDNARLANIAIKKAMSDAERDGIKYTGPKLMKAHFGTVYDDSALEGMAFRAKMNVMFRNLAGVLSPLFAPLRAGMRMIDNLSIGLYTRLSNIRIPKISIPQFNIPNISPGVGSGTFNGFIKLGSILDTTRDKFNMLRTSSQSGFSFSSGKMIFSTFTALGGVLDKVRLGFTSLKTSALASMSSINIKTSIFNAFSSFGGLLDGLRTRFQTTMASFSNAFLSASIRVNEIFARMATRSSQAIELMKAGWEKFRSFMYIKDQIPGIIDSAKSGTRNLLYKFNKIDETGQSTSAATSAIASVDAVGKSAQAVAAEVTAMFAKANEEIMALSAKAEERMAQMVARSQGMFTELIASMEAATTGAVVVSGGAVAGGSQAESAVATGVAVKAEAAGMTTAMVEGAIASGASWAEVLQMIEEKSIETAAVAKAAAQAKATAEINAALAAGASWAEVWAVIAGGADATTATVTTDAEMMKAAIATPPVISGWQLFGRTIGTVLKGIGRIAGGVMMGLMLFGPTIKQNIDDLKKAAVDANREVNKGLNFSKAEDTNTGISNIKNALESDRKKLGLSKAEAESMKLGGIGNAYNSYKSNPGTFFQVAGEQILGGVGGLFGIKTPMPKSKDIAKLKQDQKDLEHYLDLKGKIEEGLNGLLASKGYKRTGQGGYLGEGETLQGFYSRASSMAAAIGIDLTKGQEEVDKFQRALDSVHDWEPGVSADQLESDFANIVKLAEEKAKDFHDAIINMFDPKIAYDAAKAMSDAIGSALQTPDSIYNDIKSKMQQDAKDNISDTTSSTSAVNTALDAQKQSIMDNAERLKKGTTNLAKQAQIDRNAAMEIAKIEGDSSVQAALGLSESEMKNLQLQKKNVEINTAASVAMAATVEEKAAILKEAKTKIDQINDKTQFGVKPDKSKSSPDKAAARDAKQAVKEDVLPKFNDLIKGLDAGAAKNARFTELITKFRNSGLSDAAVQMFTKMGTDALPILEEFAVKSDAEVKKMIDQINASVEAATKKPPVDINEIIRQQQKQAFTTAGTKNHILELAALGFTPDMLAVASKTFGKDLPDVINAAVERIHTAKDPEAAKKEVMDMFENVYSSQNIIDSTGGIADGLKTQMQAANAAMQAPLGKMTDSIANALSLGATTGGIEAMKALAEWEKSMQVFTPTFDMGFQKTYQAWIDQNPDVGGFTDSQGRNVAGPKKPGQSQSGPLSPKNSATQVGTVNLNQGDYLDKYLGKSAKHVTWLQLMDQKKGKDDRELTDNKHKFFTPDGKRYHVYEAYDGTDYAVAYAKGGFHFSNGTENHNAQIGNGTTRIWNEPETGGEAYIPLSNSKRDRSMQILSMVADRFQMALAPKSEKRMIRGNLESKVIAGSTSRPTGYDMLGQTRYPVQNIQVVPVMVPVESKHVTEFSGPIQGLRLDEVLQAADRKKRQNNMTGGVN